MNYLEISSFIEAKKKSKTYLEQELRDVRSITGQLKAAPPVRWYNNFYYVLKRTVLIILAILSAVLLLSTFIREDSYHACFNSNFDGPISSLLNDLFGTHHSVNITVTSATEETKSEVISTEAVRRDIQEKIISNVFNYSMYTMRILLAVGILLFWYVARLTRQLYLKNKQIAGYYDSNLMLMDIYKQVIEEQRYEIEFLTKASRKLN